MNADIGLLKNYLNKLARKWVLWIFLTFDLIGVVVVYISPNLKIPTFGYLLISLIGIFWAGYQVYKDIYNELQNNPFYSAQAAFSKIKFQMPDLISEMKADLSKAGNEFIREFIVVSNKWLISGVSPSFRYYFEDHENLLSKMQILENYGFVVDVTSGKTKKYRMNEEFIELIKLS